MTTFAIFYKPSDVAAITAWVDAATLTNQQRQTAQRLWNAGLNAWAAAPAAKQDGTEPACVFAPADSNPPPASSDPDVTVVRQGDGRYLICDSTIKRVVISSGQVSKQVMVDWLRSVAASNPANGVYLLALADDLVSSAIEPYTG
jgi:hypothetical protein